MSIKKGMMKIRNSIKNKKLKHEVKVLGIALIIILLLFIIKITDTSSFDEYNKLSIGSSLKSITGKVIGYDTSGYSIMAAWDTSNTTDWGRGTYNNTLLNQTIGALALRHGNASEINWTSGPYNTTGLILYLKLNNISGLGENSTAAYDYSKNNAVIFFGNATANNKARPNWTNDGKVNNALDFDGKDDYIDVVDNAIFNSISNNFTAAVWVKFDTVNRASPDDYATLFQKDRYNSVTTPHGVLVVLGNTDTTIYYYVNGGIGASYNPVFKTKEWYHVAFTYNGTTPRIYVNGALKANGTKKANATDNSQDLLIGAENGATDSYPFDGRMDEFMMFNRTLEPDEIQYLYDSQKNQYPLSGNYESEVLQNDNASHWTNITFGGEYDYENEIDIKNDLWNQDSGLVLLMHFNNDTSKGENNTYAYDETGINNGTFGNITTNNSARPNWTATGKINSALLFDGKDDYVNITDFIDTSTKNITISAWYNTMATVNVDVIAQWSGSITSFRMVLSSGNQLVCQIYNTSTTQVIDSTGNVNDGIWHHTICMYNGTRLIMYKDGNFIGSAAGKINDSNSDILIGRNAGNSDINYFNGTIDEVAIWNRSLTADEIKELHIKGTTRLKAQVRACSDATCSTSPNYVGPDNTTNTYFTNTSNLSTGLPNTTFFQYKLFLETDNAIRNKTPFIYNMTIGYSPTLFNSAPNITLISPANGTYANSNSIFLNITVDDFDQDSLTVDFMVNTSVVNETFSNLTGFNRLNYTAVLNDGFHNWTANVTDGIDKNQSEIRFFTIDTVIPVITYNASTFANNTYSNSSNAIVNVSISESYFDNMTFGLMNSSSAIVNTSILRFNNNLNNNTIDFSIASDGLYFYNVSMYDRAGNYNATDARAATIDRIIPVITYNASTQANNSYVEQNYIFVNISLVEANLGNITFRLYNQTALLNATTYTGNNRSINWSIENQNAIYKYNITVYDMAGNINQTDTRTITLDNTTPAVSITLPKNSSSYTTGTTVTINYTITEANFDRCWYQLGNLTNVTIDCDGVGFSNETSIKGWNNITIYANDSEGHEIESSTISFLVDTVPDIPTLIMPENYTQKLLSNITFLFNSNDSDGDAFTYNMIIANDSAFTAILDEKYVSANTSYSNLSLPQGTLYYRIRANDSVAYSNYSEINSFELVNATINIYSPANNTVVYPAQVIAIYVNETTRHDWTTNISLEIIGDGVNEDYSIKNITPNINTTWNYNYTVPSSLQPASLTIIARAYNSTFGNFNSSLALVVTRSVGSAVGSPSIISFTTDPTYVVQNNAVNISLYAATDTILTTVNTSLLLPNLTTIELGYIGYSKNGLNYSYNYTYNATDTGNYTLTALITDANNQQATASRSFYTASNATITTSFTGINNTKIKDVSSKKVLLSGSSISEGLPAGKYDVEFNINEIPAVTLENASINNSFTISFNYSDLDQSTSPSNTRSLDRFQLENNIEFTQANISYNYSASLGSITTESNLKFYKCTSTGSCTWSQIATGVDEDNNIATGLFGNFSVFTLAESVATTTTTVTQAGGGGGGVGGANARFYNIDIIAPLPVALGLNENTVIPVRIKNNGEVGLNGIRISLLPNSTNIKAASSLSSIPYLDVNREVIADISVETANSTGSYSIAVKAESFVPAFTEISYIYINAGQGISSNNTIVVEKIKFVKDLFKENPECLELNEVIVQAEDALKEKRYDKALSLTETAINACKDLVASKGRVLRMPVKVYDKKAIVLSAIISTSVVLLIWFITSLIKKKNKKPKQNKLFKNLKRVK